MKKIIPIFLACVLCMSPATPAFAHDYSFSTGEGTIPGFGKSTSSDNPVSPDPMSENTRRNKDTSALPPPYFYGSGDIPTDTSSLYHAGDSGQGGIGDSVEGIGHSEQGIVDSGGIASGDYPNGSSLSTINYPLYTPKYYPDGSIGSIYVARTEKNVKVYEGEDLANLRKGAGHFSSTGTWDGNVSLCGHNRESWPYFSFVKNLNIGDRITYTTLYGTRVYEVFSKEQIGEYDYSKIARSAENLLTLVTCVENIPELRWAAQCREVR